MFELRHSRASPALLSVPHLIRVRTSTVSSSILRALVCLCSNPFRGHCIQDPINAIKRKHANGRSVCRQRVSRCLGYADTSQQHVTVHVLIQSRPCSAFADIGRLYQAYLPRQMRNH
ncbi:hypothetical protein KVT40_006325 [Elsinoe batatas]|uniref:Uncharacterized protein n=1 Tax=Elsinoe batatas TaxID=2601811 RepID=A0A8K0KXR0_9PEZI|nr:hypothetical protein KVT40_006325 [Elsinoe batatas]